MAVSSKQSSTESGAGVTAAAELLSDDRDWLYGPVPVAALFHDTAEPVRRRFLLLMALAVLCSAAVAVAGGLPGPAGLTLSLGGVQAHPAIWPPAIFGVLISCWFGAVWGFGVTFISSLALALSHGLPLPWATLMALSTAAGMIVVGLAYRTTPIAADLRSTRSLVFFLFVSYFAALVSSSAAFVQAAIRHLSASDTFREWQSWWVGTFLQSVIFTLPLLWAAGRPVLRWKKRLALHRPWQAPSTNDIGIVFGLMLFVLSMFILGASYLARLNLKTTLQGVRDRALVELISAAAESLSLIDWVSFGFIIFTGYFGYQLAINWTQSLRQQIEAQMKSLRESEERYRLLFEINPQPMYVYDRNTLEFLAVNQAMTDSYGYPRDELLRMTLRDIRPPEDVPRVLEKIAGAQPGINEGGQWRHRKRDGTLIIVEVAYHQLDFAGRPAILAQAVDITDRRRTEEKIRKLNDYLESSVRERTAQLAAANTELHREVGERRRAEEILRQTNYTLETLIQASPLAIILLDPQGRVQVWNAAAERMFGWTEAEVIGHALPLGEGREREEFNTLGEVVMQGVPFSVMDLRTQRRDSTAIDISISAAPVTDTDGRISGVVAVITDITERKRAEVQLRESEERYRDLFENANDLIQSVGLDGRLLYANRAWLETLGYSRDEISRLTMFDIIDPSQHAHCFEALKSVMTGHPVTRVETVFVTRDGRRIIVEGSINCRFENGKPVSTRGIFRDITERKQAEEELRASEANVRAIIEYMLSGLILTDDRGFIQLVNPAAEKIFGYKADEMIGQHLAMLMPEMTGDDRARFLRQARQKARGRVTEWEGRRKNGEIFPFELSFYEFNTPEGRRFAGHIRDLSERREVDKLKKEFISTVSHELRTPLTSIRGSLRLLAGGAFGELPREAVEMVMVADRNTVRLLELINDILDLERLESGRMEMHFAAQPLAEVFDRALESVIAFAAQQQISIRLQPTTAAVLGDGDRLVQVLINLLSNAIKFSPAGSEVMVSATVQDGSIEVRVQDHGRGIPAAFLDKVFERFRQVEASDDRQKGGTGLGLAICRNIIEQHHGTIGVDSAEGRGSTFWFRLPAAAESIVSAETAAPPRVSVT
ncbi:MAG: PAS domain S-box protein [Blastocatellia bacterium]